MWRKVGIAALGGLLGVACLEAESSPLVCPPTDYASSVVLGAPVRLELITEIEALGELDPEAEPTDTLGPFDGTRYSFTRLEVFLADRVLTAEQGPVPHRVDVLVHTFCDNQGAWWRLTNERGGPLDVELERCMTCPSQAVSYSGPLHDRQTPLIVVSLWTGYAGLGSGSTIKAMTVLDFRSSQPRVLATFECEGLEYLGMPCSFAMGQIGTREQVECAWIPEEEDLRCDLTRIVTLPWTERRFREAFMLGGAKALRLPPPEPSFPSLAEVVRRVQGSKHEPPRTAYVDNLGWLRWIGGWQVPGRSSRVDLFVSGGTGDDYLPVFFAVGPWSKDGSVAVPIETLPPSVDEALDRRGWSSDRRRTEGVADGQPMSDAPEIGGVKEKFAADGLLVLEVEVAEGDGFGVFWIAVDGRAHEPRVGALRLSATAGAPADCGAEYIPSCAGRVTIEGRPFHAHVEIDPPSELGGIHNTDQALACPSKALILWDVDLGFVVEDGEERCPEVGKKATDDAPGQ